MSALELRVPPVLQVIIVGVGMWGLAVLFPGFNAPFSPAIVASALLTLIGTAVAVLGVLEFRKAKTTIDPRVPDRSTHLVKTGVFRFSRNPMYLGLFLVLSGWAFYLMNLLAFFLLPGFVLYMNAYQIKAEERHMAQKFGEAFTAYSEKVRRWI